jgi:hypothetical protein
MSRDNGHPGGGVYDVYMIKSDSLMVLRPHGLLGARMTEKIIELVEIKEEQVETGFNRFCDLTHIDGIRLSMIEIFKLAERRRVFNPNDIHVKSAFLATDPLAFGIARMYEQLLHSPRIDVQVWDDLQSAAAWLGVEKDRLTL